MAKSRAASTLELLDIMVAPDSNGTLAQPQHMLVPGQSRTRRCAWTEAVCELGYSKIEEQEEEPHAWMTPLLM
jgi:hypothetical protein